MTSITDAPTALDVAAAPLQPLLYNDSIILSAPTHAWSDKSGVIGTRGAHGFWAGDQRVVSHVDATFAGTDIEDIAATSSTAEHVRFSAVLRGLDDEGPGADPDVRLDRDRIATTDAVTETFAVSTRYHAPIDVHLELVVTPDASTMHQIKEGFPATRAMAAASDAGATWRAGAVDVTLEAPGADITIEDGRVRLRWSGLAAAKAPSTFTYTVRTSTSDPVVRGVNTPCPWTIPTDVRDDRLRRWLEQASTDLNALRMVKVDGTDEFLAAGAPWFFTLFGRDSLWAARFLLPINTTIAASTLRALATLQGTKVDEITAEQPGKIMHEIRQASLTAGQEEQFLSPLYYGTIDATPLWICLLHDAWRAGMPEREVRDLLPALHAAMNWMRDYGDSDGDGLLEYVDTTGRGLANQGWKDSGDSVQWNDGRIAEAPIALCEVQAYAYEAAAHGADLLEALGEDGADEWRVWAEKLATKFRSTFWLEDDGGRYPAIALDVHKNPVDSVTSNIGHLVGTGLLNHDEEQAVADRLVASDMSSGFGLRTLSTTADGYWPLSYHVGSVWTHDTAVVIAGLTKAGFPDQARILAEGLLAAATSFEYRMPELHSGDASTDVAAPAPYPAACRPQAWSAAAAFPVWVALEQ